VSGLSIGIDVGGTYTDLAAVDASGRITTRKVLSTPGDQSVGVERALAALGADPSDVERIVHGTTIVTNMLLERAGARVALCATAGATDLLELRRQERRSLYDLSAHHPAPLVPHEHTVPVDERIGPEGVTRELTESNCASVADSVQRLDPEIVAIALLHAYADPGHERRLAAALRLRLPDVDVVLSSDVLPEIREYERTATTVAEAYARPGVSRYLRTLAERIRAAGYPAPGVMTSSGGTRAADEAARSAASLALSGPAGGVVGAAAVLRMAGFERALTIDIGGTSADVGLILDGEPLVESGGMVAGVPIALPRVLVETVSAGGGSIGWIDDGGALRVGPRSAGAVPGPAAFGRGGTAATVTDAHVSLGHIQAGRLSGGVELDADAAVRAIGTLAESLGSDPAAIARAMIAVADAEMARALRRVSVERGVDPRECILVAFGGGGPLHACALASTLGMDRIMVPAHAGVLSAVGLALAAERRESLASVMRPSSQLDVSRLRELAADLAGRASGGERRLWWLRARYRGQGHELDVPFAPGDDGPAIAARFVRLHANRFGFTLERDVEVVSARHSASGPPRGATFAAGEPGGTIRGPATVALADATLLVPDEWAARPLSVGGWMVERGGATRNARRDAQPSATHRNPP
jgi:N-methylhydantoinase A